MTNGIPHRGIPFFVADDVRYNFSVYDVVRKGMPTSMRQGFDNEKYIEHHLREGGLQRGKALDVGAHQRVRQSQVLRTGLGGHFGLGDGGALEAVDARLDLHLDHLGHLVGLDVGPQAGSAACNVDHLADILADDRRVIDQLRAYDVLLTLKGIEVVVDLIHTPPASRSRPRCCPGRNWCPWRCGRADPSPRRTARTAGWSRR